MNMRNNIIGFLKTSQCGHICTFVAMFLCGIIFMVAMQYWWTSAKPLPVVVKSIVQSTQQNGNRILEVESSGPATRDCLRVTQHLLYNFYNTKDGSERTSYVPLGVALSGMGYGSRPEFKVTLEVPEHVIPGKWNYVNRSVYFCSIFPGFTKITQVVSENTAVDLK